MITPSFSLTATERVIPRLALDFTTASLDSRVTFTRAGNTATVVNLLGLIENVNADIPRFDYTLNTGGACKGLLIEESRTNACLRSGDQSVSPWLAQVTGTATIATTQNYAVAPDNTQTATRVVMNLNGGGGSTGNYCWLTQPIAVTSGVAYAATFYAKTNDGTTKTISVRDDSSAATFNTLRTITGSWQRIVVTGTAGTTVNANFKIWLRGGIGTSTDADLSVWGFQWEAGAFATSYIPTTSAALTRNADVAVITGTNFSDWWNASQGAIEFQFVRKSNAVAGKYPYTGYILTDANNRFDFYQNSNTNETVSIKAGGATVASFTSTVQAGGSTIKQSLAYATNSFAYALNGGSPSLDTGGAVPSVSEFHIGGAASTGFELNGWMQKINYWPQRITNAEVQAVSK